VELAVLNRAGCARITVQDNGSGIPEEHLESVFDRFYRVDAARTRAAGGAGLGLAIVRSIVEAHGGTVDARNASAGGAVFSVRLPAADEAVRSGGSSDTN